MTSAIKAQNTVFRYAGSPSAEIEEVTSVKPSGSSVTAIDATHLKSAAKEYIAGLKDGGSVDFTANFTNGTVQQQVRRDFDAGTTVSMEIYIPAASPVTISFAGFFTKLDGPDANVDNKLEISGTFKISGAVTVA